MYIYLSQFQKVNWLQNFKHRRNLLFADLNLYMTDNSPYQGTIPFWLYFVLLNLISVFLYVDSVHFFYKLHTHRNTLIRSKDTINIKSQWNCFLMPTMTEIQPVFKKCRNFHVGYVGTISTSSCSHCWRSSWANNQNKVWVFTWYIKTRGCYYSGNATIASVSCVYHYFAMLDLWSQNRN